MIVISCCTREISIAVVTSATWFVLTAQRYINKSGYASPVVDAGEILNAGALKSGNYFRKVHLSRAQCAISLILSGVCLD